MINSNSKPSNESISPKMYRFVFKIMVGLLGRFFLKHKGESIQSFISELEGGSSVTQVITHYNMSPIFLLPPLGIIGKFSLPDWLSGEPQTAGFSQSAGFPVLWWEGRQRRHRQNVAVYFHSVMCVNLITGR